MAQSRKKAPRFEDRLQQLTDIVEELEQGELSLEQAIERFEKGKGLHRQLMAELETYEARLEKLVEGAGGEDHLEAVEETPSPRKRGRGEA